MSVTNTREYGEGYSAYESKLDRHANPYRRSSPLGKRWDVGWEDAKTDYSQDTASGRVTYMDNPILEAVASEIMK